MGREFELKYKANDRIQAAIRQDFAGFREISMGTTYFDTADGALSAQKVTLRLRRENGVTVCTLKTPLPDGSRGEWECHAQQIREGLSILADLGAPAEILRLAQQELVAVCGAKFTRLAAEVATADGTAELALDSGILLGGSRSAPLREVEVELKTGSDEAALAFARELAAKYGLVPEKHSKFRRALALAKGE